MHIALYHSTHAFTITVAHIRERTRTGIVQEPHDPNSLQHGGFGGAEGRGSAVSGESKQHA